MLDLKLMIRKLSINLEVSVVQKTQEYLYIIIMYYLHTENS